MPTFAHCKQLSRLMKRYGTFILCTMAVWLACLQAKAQMVPLKQYAHVYEMDTYKGMDMAEVGRGWASRPIKVSNGGNTPNIVTLMKAFNEVWNVNVVEGVLNCAKDPNFTKAVDKEYDSTTIVDRKNGYMCEDSGGTDSDYMEACVWRRNNGHRLLAVYLGGSCNPDIQVVCFYDYDPSTETLTPEESPVDTFKGTGCEYVSFSLPHKGKDFIITEFLTDQGTLKYVYTWDGYKHTFHHREAIPEKE